MGPLNSRILRCRESSTAEPQQPEAQAGPSYVSGSHKRKQRSGPCLGPETENSHRFLDQDEDLQQVVSTSQGKKVKITSEYAYQTLFLNGETSDIKIRALGKVWCLHKMFLCQSNYFATMFTGSWKESHKDIIDLEIDDQNIDVESLHFVLGSLYRNEYVLTEPLQVPGILATTCLLQVEDLIQLCDETMKETINVQTVCGYYAAAETYGLDSVKTGCFEWLLHNLMTHPSIELYKELSTDLMNLLISSSNLSVMQKEIDVYTTLKEWMFLRLNLGWKGSMRQLLVNANNWFSRHRECVGNISFLETKQGIVFQPVFKNLRFQHIICDLASTKVIEQDTIIPSEWLSSVYKRQWFTFLRAQHYGEIGPRDINETELEEYSMRCGKRIVKDGKYSWKLSGYNFGFPLYVIFTSHYIIFKQNTFSHAYDDSICLQPLRNIAFRLTLVYFDSSGKLSFRKTTGYKILTFEKDEEQVVMKLDSISLSFPIYIFCNFLFISLENPGN
ncbi:germ cell-less protein-like 2 [Hippopotamus amphibius kiboko]|uniref:germ cell-less protein-like 2 n=1 Tax=Hippopotamus amphibius kiboko TaxID=575201 RepID=UPI00259ADFFA|nr:germ cell-less protein-like 2 [Hippopotamus amphibius kiboko]